jgi:hypothetical protein
LFYKNQRNKRKAVLMSGKFDFGACFNKAWEVYKQNLMLLVGASFVATLLSAITFGILAGPLVAGVLTLMLKFIDGKTDAKFDDIFSRFDIFVPTLLLCLVWGVAAGVASMILEMIPLAGQVASFLLSVGVSVFLTFAILQVAEKGLGFGDASRSSWEMLKRDFWPLIGFSAVASIVSCIGLFACVIGVIFTAPMFYLMMASAYRNCSTAGPMIDITPAAPSEPPPAQ